MVGEFGRRKRKRKRKRKKKRKETTTKKIESGIGSNGSKRSKSGAKSQKGRNVNSLALLLSPPRPLSPYRCKSPVRRHDLELIKRSFSTKDVSLPHTEKPQLGQLTVHSAGRFILQAVFLNAMEPSSTLVKSNKDVHLKWLQEAPQEDSYMKGFSYDRQEVPSRYEALYFPLFYFLFV